MNDRPSIMRLNPPRSSKSIFLSRFWSAPIKHCTQALSLVFLFCLSPCLRSNIFAIDQQSAQPTTPDDVIQTVVDAIQKHYLNAKANPLWNISRDTLQAGKYKDVAEALQAVQKQMPYMEDTELNLLTPDEVATLQAEALGQKVDLGLSDFCLDAQVETGRARVVTAIVGSPAMKAGIEPRDIIVSINGKHTSDLSHEQVVDTLHAPAPEGIKLELERGERTLTTVLQPSSEKVDVLQSAKKNVSGKNIGYLRIALFTPDVAQQASDALTKLEQGGVDGYVLDLRNNPGGFLNSARKIAALFTAGTLGFELRGNGQKEPVEEKGAPVTKKPLAVLINGGTASAAEFLAGALQGTHRGALVGEQSYGRGRAQRFVFIANGYGLQIPSVELLTSDGHGIKGKGLAPDVEVKQPQLLESEIAGPHDKQFLKAVQTLTADQH
jgi:carboxyl-terminal processing protease